MKSGGPKKENGNKAFWGESDRVQGTQVILERGPWRGISSAPPCGLAGRYLERAGTEVLKEMPGSFFLGVWGGGGESRRPRGIAPPHSR